MGMSNDVKKIIYESLFVLLKILMYEAKSGATSER